VGRRLKYVGAVLVLVLVAGCDRSRPSAAPPKATWIPRPHADPSRPFTEAVRVGDMLYLSGELGTDSTGHLVSGGIEAETRQAMDNIQAKLSRNGSSIDNVVKCTVMLADMNEWSAMNQVYATYFKKHFPARSAFGTTGLALGARMEIECTATVDPPL
jgi:2-iminobutanoate/2-iminopropanoate deaminase